MSTKDKLIEKLLSKPKDFTYDELKTILRYWGYKEDTHGNGSRVSFFNDETKAVIKIHKPHPSNIIKPYVVELIIEKLKKDGFI